MEITEVKVFPIEEEKLKAFVSVVFDHCFMVNDIKIIQGRDGLFISMPSRKKKNGEFKDVAHPLNNETRRMIEGCILGDYQRILAERGEELPAPPRTQPVARPAVAPPAPVEARPPVAPAAAAAFQSIPSLPVDGDGTAAGLAPAAAAVEEVEPPPGEDRSLEEIQELHLRDSFWSVP
jgi:stage V sporulation protein G